MPPQDTSREEGIGSYNYDREEGSVRIDLTGSFYGASIADFEEVMGKVIDILRGLEEVNRVVLVQDREYEYDSYQTHLLKEIAEVLNKIRREKLITPSNLALPNCDRHIAQRTNFLQNIVVNTIRRDPIGAFVKLKRKIEEVEVQKEESEGKPKRCYRFYINKALKPLKEALEETELIQKVEDQLPGHHVGDREIYRQIFHPNIRPHFMMTRYKSKIPEGADEVDRYEIEEVDAEVEIFRVPGDVRLNYHVIPPEFNLDETSYTILDQARRYMAEHEPTEAEFAEPERTRKIFYNIGKDMIEDIAENQGVDFEPGKLEQLANILTRYTAGLGILEVLLADPHLQDVYVNSPIGSTPIYAIHGNYGECKTNLIPTRDDAEAWATRFRMKSGRPLDEANPVLDTEAEVPGGRARVAIITQNLSPEGLAFAFRRHRGKPWTYPLFISNDMFNPLAAGLMSFIIDGSRTMLIAGTRSSGKCVDGDTLIQLSDGNIKKIKDLVGEQKREIDDGTVHKPSKTSSSRVPALHTDLNTYQDRLTDVWRRESPEKLVKIKTRSGKEIITTKEHPYFTYRGELSQIRSDNLKEGDMIATPRKLDIEGEEKTLDLEDEPYCREVKQNNYILRKKNCSLEVKFPKELNQELAEFIGLVVGDGHLNKRKLEFHNNDKKTRDRFTEVLNDFGIPYNVFESHSTTVVNANSRTLTKALNEIFEVPFGKKSGRVKIPEVILRAPDEILAAFLRGYFDADGYIHEDKREIEIATASEEMSEHLRLALLRFGVVVYTKERTYKGFKSYRVFIRGKMLEKFAESVDFSHEKKRARLKSHMSEEHLDNTNVDAIPEGGKILKELREKLRASPSDVRESGKDYWAYENEEYRVSRKWFKKLVDFYKERYKELKSMEDQVKELRKFAKFDCGDYLKDMEKARKLLGLSYVTLSTESGVSERGIRKVLKNEKVGGAKTLGKIEKIIDKLEEKLEKLSSLSRAEVKVDNLPEFIEKGDITYAGISRRTEIPETTLKYYAYGDSSSKMERSKRESVESRLNEFKRHLSEELEESSKLLNNLNQEEFISKSLNQGILLQRMRKKLNISNEELSSEEVSAATVSNFFNERYEPSLETVKSIADKTVQIYESAVSEDVKDLIEKASKLANSQVFWDEVKSVEIINSENDDVYDLSVERTHNFVANGFFAHNTSLMSACLTELMKRYRVVTVEDSVSGDSNILVKRNNEIEKSTVGELIDGLIEDSESKSEERLGRELIYSKDIEDGIEVYSINKNGKVNFEPVSAFIRHSTDKPIFEIETSTGRKLKVTGDHSLFGVGENEVMRELKVKDLKKGDNIAVPRKYKEGEGKKERESINLLDHLEELYGFFISGERVKPFIESNWEDVKKAKEELDYSRKMPSYWKKNLILPVEVYEYLDQGLDPEKVSIKPKRGGKEIPASLPLNNKFLNLVGLWLADGCYDKKSVLISVVEEELRDLVSEVAESLGIEVKMHSDTFTLMLNSTVFRTVMENILKLKGDSYTKEIPEWVYNLSKGQKASVLKGIFSGDGCVSEKEIVIPLASDKLLNDLQSLLLNYGIILRRSNKRKEDGTFNTGISALKSHKNFKKDIGILVKEKRRKLKRLCSKTSTHDSSDVVPLNMKTKKEMSEICGGFQKHDYITRNNNIGREKLKELVSEVPERNKLLNPLKKLAHSDLLWDKVVNIEKKEPEKYVYDLSVPGNENFVCENIVAHNTLELPVPSLRDLGYNVERMKSRSVITQVESELPADEAIRTALRLGDSVLILGEVRSVEAKALYEAMRIGALANFVGGTIHGESAYGVFDRVVNDLGVPKTSFKATDIVTICNTLKSPDGLHTYRRVTNITEVRKEWNEDPMREGAFVDLMTYDSSQDKLVPTDTLLNGESVILSRIASNVREWKNDWNAVWDNIQLRKKVKKKIVDLAKKSGKDEALEAEFSVKANEKYHELSEKVQREYGSLDSERIYQRWEEWAKNAVKSL